MDLITGLRRMFYIILPSESSFATVKEVPNYVGEAYPFFFILVAAEFAFLKLRKWKRVPRLNDSISSISAGIISQIPLLFARSIELMAYIYVYDNYRLWTLDWSKASTWMLALVGVDFGYYWLHRMGHEWHFFWASHQVHHSSEEYNLTTALRQSFWQRYIGWIFYIPMALAVPPSIFLVHLQFNLIYQFWIHTEAISSLGPLEYIINTPAHHRVHHGRNRYCIDKNYGGTFIIWDRMFGTFAAERPIKDPVVYGLVHPLENWNPIWIQLHNYIYLFWRVIEVKGFANKLRVFFYGPGWDEGKPRLGEIQDIPDIHAPQPVYNRRPKSLAINVYIFAHFAGLLLTFILVTNTASQNSYLDLALYNSWVVFSLFCFAAILECRSWSLYLEATRCIGTVLFSLTAANLAICQRLDHIFHPIFIAGFTVSSALWLLLCLVVPGTCRRLIKSADVELESKKTS